MAIGRPLSFDPEQTLERVSEVFRARGFEAASLQDLLKATGLSKSSLYQQFGNKQRLFDRCLDRYAEGVEQEMREALAAAPGGREFFAGLLQKIIDEPRPQQGCLLFNTASELGHLNPAVAAQVQGFFLRLRAVFVEAIEIDRVAGRLPAEPPAIDLANYLLAASAGLRDLAKGGLPPEELRRCGDLILDRLR